MTHKEELAEIEWQYTTGVIDYEEYRASVKSLWSKQQPSRPRQPLCALEFNPEPGIKVRTTLARGGMSR